MMREESTRLGIVLPDENLSSDKESVSLLCWRKQTIQAAAVQLAGHGHAP